MSFFSPYRHEFVRVAACVPRIGVGDPAFNVAQTLDLVRSGDAQKIALMIFPELGISAYAIDDLLFQDALLDRVEAALRRTIGSFARVCSQSSSSVRHCVAAANCSTAPCHLSRHDSRRCAENLSAQLSRILRGAPVHVGGGYSRRRRSTSRVTASRSASTFCSNRTAPYRSRLTLRFARTSGCRSRLQRRRRSPVRKFCSICPPAISPSVKRKRAACCVRRSRLAALRPMPIRPLVRANRPPIWPGTVTRRCSNTATSSPKPSASHCSRPWPSPMSISACCDRNACGWARLATASGAIATPRKNFRTITFHARRAGRVNYC